MEENKFDELPPVRPVDHLEPSGSDSLNVPPYKNEVQQNIESEHAPSMQDHTNQVAQSYAVQDQNSPPSQVAPVAGTTNTPQLAEDGDLIEKEWVKKAKHIVEQTKNDPHQQSKGLNQVKSDYLKKRYNYDLKNEAN